MKIKMSYDDFDNLIEKIDNAPIPEDYEFPSLEEAEENLTTLPGVAIVLFAAEKTEDQEYAKALNQLIKEYVDFTEEVSEDKELTFVNDTDRYMKIFDKVKSMDLQIAGFCPSKDEIDLIASKNLNKDNTALGFLLWVSSWADDNNSFSDMKSIAQYTRKILNEKLKK